MIDMLRRSLSGREPGQSLIFVAILASSLLLTTGVAVEGGHGLVEQRKLQAAADMAALIGAQGLPCATSNSTCITQAETNACTYATDNGYSGCVAGGSSGSWASVPPRACSPYDFIDYGNNSLNANCKTGTAPSYYYYIEVHLQETLHLAIVNVNVTLAAHAVARRGIPTAQDYALSILDPTQSRALNMSGSKSTGFVMVGSAVVDSTAADAIYTGGSNQPIACDGQWYTASSETGPPGGNAGNVQTNTSGTALWAPASCTGGSDNSPPYFNQTSSVPDTYASSVAPLTCSTGSTPNCSGTMAGCSMCSSDAWYYTWPNSPSSSVCNSVNDPHLCGSWSQATSTTQPVKLTGANNVELFPGVYPGGISISSNAGAQIFLNPGIYSLGGGFSMSGGASICIFGAPVCDSPTNIVNGNGNNVGLSCSDVSFNSGDPYYVTSGSYYYNCSHWGWWDDANLGSQTNPQSSLTTRPAAVCATCAPTFVNSDGTASSNPLNGVVFYMYGGSVSLNGNSLEDFASPNPCPGTGSQTGQSTSFPQGSSTGDYNYPNTSVIFQDSKHTTSPAGQVYPSMDLTLSGECASTNWGNDWNQEFGSTTTQHLHFLFWARSATISMSLNGGSAQGWWGILYNPGNSSSGGGCALSCQITINGTASTVGPPMFAGQIVADNVKFTGTAVITLYYRPCVPGNSACGLGPGTSLVE
jgi:Putative Flp pilus-assembly TadE/G-like